MWLHIPESLVSAPDTEDSTSLSDSFFQALAQCATLSGKFRQPVFLRRAWQMGALTPLRFGQTLPPSTLDDGLDQWISSWQDSPVNPTQSPENGTEPTTTDGSLMTSSALHVSAAHQQCFSKMSQGFLRPVTALHSTKFFRAWPRSGWSRNGLVYRAETLARHLRATESSSWHRPTATDYHGSSKNGPRNGTVALDVRIHCESRGGCGRVTHVPNPALFEWLMGIPIGWTSVEPIASEQAEMVWSLCRQRLR